MLDEADRLLEMGFKEELMQIVSQCKHPKRQTLMVSATLNQDLKELANLALKKPLQFSVDRQQRKTDIKNIKLTQYVVRLQLDGLAAFKKGTHIFDSLQRAKRTQGPKGGKKKKKKLDPDHPDFDSEEEYGNEAKDYVSSEEEESVDDLMEGADESAEEEPINRNRGGGNRFTGDDGYTVKKVPPNEYLIKRESTLLAILKRSFKTRVIIFCNEKIQCTRLLALLTMYGFKAVECHGNMDQVQRLEAVEKFQLGQSDFLIATDLIARGLDITNVRAVINFSFPTEPKRFLHRIGRTARAGQHGVAITLCNEEERKDLKKLNRKLN